MNMENFLRKLADNARMETPPDVDIADNVMLIISSQQLRNQVYDKPFVWMASLSSAAAIAIGTLAIYAYYAWTNPLAEISDTIAWAL
jgi:hypothetical protein